MFVLSPGVKFCPTADIYKQTKKLLQAHGRGHLSPKVQINE